MSHICPRLHFLVMGRLFRSPTKSLFSRMRGFCSGIEEFLAPRRDKRQTDNRFVDSNDDIIDVISHIRFLFVRVSDEREFIHRRSRLVRDVCLSSERDHGLLDPFLMDDKIVGTLVNVVGSVHDLPDKRFQHKQLLRHAVRNLAKVACACLEPKSKAIFAEVEPMTTRQGNVELFVRCRVMNAKWRKSFPLDRGAKYPGSSGKSPSPATSRISTDRYPLRRLVPVRRTVPRELAKTANVSGPVASCASSKL